MSESNDQMSFLEHLEELRWRIVRAVIAIISGALVAFIFKNWIFDGLILAPKDSNFITYRLFCKWSTQLGLGDGFCVQSNLELQNIEMSGQFTSHIIVSLIAGIIVSFPYVFYQFWAFIKPGLKERERKGVRGIVFFTTLLFLLGISFGFFLIAPLSVQFLGNYTVSDQVSNIITLNSYISTVTTTTLASGLVFQLPMVIYFLARFGVVNATILRTYRKHAIVGILIIAAVITPPDITSQILVSLPLMLLYEISIHIARIVVRNKALREATPNAG